MSLDPIVLDADNPGPMTGSGSNTYLLAGTEGRFLSMPGVGRSRHLAAIDRELGGSKLARVLVTHGHIDHSLWCTEHRRTTSRGDFREVSLAGQRQALRRALAAARGGDTVSLDGQSLTVIHTPGHSPDHATFWHEETRSAFTGDLIIQGGSVVISWAYGGNVAAYLASLERLIRLQPAVMFPAHGPSSKNLVAALARSIEHRLEREQQIIQALREVGQPYRRSLSPFIMDSIPRCRQRRAGACVLHLEKAEGGKASFQRRRSVESLTDN